MLHPACMQWAQEASNTCAWGLSEHAHRIIRKQKKGSLRKGLFTGGISRISRVSKFSRISRKWSDFPLFSTVWGFFRISDSISRISISKNSLIISRIWTFLKRPLFQKTLFFLGNLNHAYTDNTVPLLHFWISFFFSEGFLAFLCVFKQPPEGPSTACFIVLFRPPPP